jgi:hypothetical protein
MLALDSLNTEPDPPTDVVVVAIIFADDDEDVLLLPGDATICAITLCEMSGAAKRENITAVVVSTDDFSNRVFLFVLFEEAINLIAMCLY